VSDEAGTVSSAFLVTVNGPSPGQRFPLGERESIIGRGPGVGIYLESPFVSRQHARIVPGGGVYHVEDLGSTNGTFVNGKRIAGRVLLGERDTLGIGPYEMTLRVDPAPNPTEPAPMNVPRHIKDVQNPPDKPRGGLEACRGQRECFWRQIRSATRAQAGCVRVATALSSAGAAPPPVTGA
jgi:hypothetical protein